MSQAVEQDPFHLQRFVASQAKVYPAVLLELQAGQKRSHWMWFIFPQVDGLGMSETTHFYAIKSRAEAIAYLEHPLLGARLRECIAILLRFRNRSAYEIFGSPDDLKLQSCLTLFASVAEDAAPFKQALEMFYGGQPDVRTLEILNQWQRAA